MRLATGSAGDAAQTGLDEGNGYGCGGVAGAERDTDFPEMGLGHQTPS